MSKQLRERATALLLTDLLDLLSEESHRELCERWGCEPGGLLLDAVVAKLRCERDTERTHLTKLAKAEAETLEAWLAEATGFPVKVRWATDRIVRAYAKRAQRRAMVLNVDAVRPKPGAPFGYRASVDVPIVGPFGEHIRQRPFESYDLCDTPLEALRWAVGLALASDGSSAKHRADLQAIQERLWAQPEGKP